MVLQRHQDTEWWIWSEAIQ